MLARYLVAAVIVLGIVLGVMLVIRPLIFSVAEPRDDTRVAILPQVQLSSGPQVRQAVLVATHGLDGETTVDGRPVVTLVVAPLPGGGAVVVNAAPPANASCTVEIGADRLIGCGGSWTLSGEPIDAGLGGLQRFPVTLRDGAVYVDLTAPERAGG